MRVDHPMPWVHARDLVIQEARVERRVVGHQKRIAHEVEPFWSDLGKERRVSDHVVRNTRQRRDEAWNRNFRIDECVELIDDVSAANSKSTELDQSIRRSLRARGFDVDDNELEIFQETQMAVVCE